MGALCGGEAQSPEERKRLKAEKDRSKRLEQQMSAAQSADQQINKLLLLGAGESGKSTLFKQMITIYGTGFPDHERKSYAPIIYNNILTSIQTLTEQAQIMDETIACKESLQRIDEIKGDEEIDKDLAEHIKNLWADEGIQRVYGRRAQYQLTDSAAYFFTKLDVVSEEGYVPSEQDVLRSRVRTTGIVENEFVIEENQFKMYDVGGQRNERKKWIHCFENVTAVLFVAAISAYDQVLYEDENTNRMHEALNLFREICNSRWFERTSMILFLNKCDLFEDKIQKVSIKCCFPEYDGPDNDYHEAVEFIQAQFENRNEHPDTKKLYPHVTCATDTANVAHVFDSVKDIVIRDSLDQAGLV